MASRVRTRKDKTVTSVSFPDEALLHAARKRAADRRISFSQYINQLLAKDLADDSNDSDLTSLINRLASLEESVASLLETPTSPPIELPVKTAFGITPIQGAARAAKQASRKKK